VGKMISIIGAGNGGQAFAGYLSLQDWKVKLYDISQETVDILNKKGGVHIEGSANVEGFGEILLASTDIGEVINGTKIILVTLPSIYHKEIARKIAPYLVDGQFIMLNPCTALGAVEFRKELNDCTCTADILLGCTSTLLFACRAIEIGRVIVAGQKASITASTYPSCNNAIAAKIFKDIIPQAQFCGDIIQIGLDNIGALVHPGPTILNTGRIESGTEFEYYLDITPTQGLLVDRLDEERMAIARAFGLTVKSLVDIYEALYQIKGKNVYEVLTGCDAYNGIKGPTTLRTRYLLEDVPYGLCAFQTLGIIAGVPTPCIDALITLARKIIPEMEEGRTPENLGLEGVSKEEFIKSCRS